MHIDEDMKKARNAEKPEGFNYWFPPEQNQWLKKKAAEFKQLRLAEEEKQGKLF